MTGVRFTDADWQANKGAGHKVHVLDFGHHRNLAALSTAAGSYIRRAEALGLHLGYKCRTRNPWYKVPSIYVPDAFLLRQIHNYPKLIVNETAATCTDTIHRVRFSSGIDRRLVANAFLNSLTFAFAEVLGRSYGGGVLELEPNEANRLPIPLRHAESLDHDAIDRLVRTAEMTAVLDATDRLLLRDALGLSKRQVVMLRSVWAKLRTRRTERRNAGLSRKVRRTAAAHRLVQPAPGR